MLKLTDTKLRSLKTPGKHSDGGGLYLEVTPTGGRYWRWKYRFGGKEKRLAFGVYPDVSLKLARERHVAARQVLAAGSDPAAHKREQAAALEQQVATTVEGVAREWLDHMAGSWTPGTLDAIKASLETHVFPQIGSRPIAHTRPREVVDVVKAIESAGAAETAGRVLQRLKAIYRYAVVHERIEKNPMLDLKPAELLKPRQVRHRAALAQHQLPTLLAALGAYQGEPTTVGALRLLMLTAVRPGELRLARWLEFDLVEEIWRIPAERMKMRRPHLVPLSRQAQLVLTTMKVVSGSSELVFPSPFYPGKPLSENTLNSALARMGFKGEHSAHGFRAVFSTIANEHGHSSDAIERQLAHVEGNEVRAAYHRAEYLAQRRQLLQWWGDYLEERDARLSQTEPFPLPLAAASS